MEYEGIILTEEVHIEKIVTIHYFEYMKDFYFQGEAHDFWEFQCVDKGEVKVLDHTLKAGQLIFHKPNEFHDLVANGEIAPNVVVVSFECSSPAMQALEGKILTLTERERELIGMIIQEARLCIKPPFDDPYLKRMEKRDDASFGSEQFVRIYLECLLLGMIRRCLPEPVCERGSDRKRTGTDSELYNQVSAYLEQHICDCLTIEDICRDNLLGRSQLQKMFRIYAGSGPIEYFTKMKIEYAKQLIRENNQNFTQISEVLGYSSIHYFSRQFKKVTGMTPTEYVTSVKARSERRHGR